jgi:RNA polymerase sigma-70 factor (ECF subfamily)
VLEAGQDRGAATEEALAKLCQTYWYPLYAYLRRQGRNPHDAQDLTQEYFSQLLKKNYLSEARRERGKFRSFLLASLNHFLANEWHRMATQKRGGGQPLLSLDAESTESRYRLEPVDKMTPEKTFERRWAITLLEQVLLMLQREYETAGRKEFFERLKFSLTGERSELPYAELAAQLGMSEGAVKAAVHRLRARYRDILCREIANTVSSPEEIEDELRHFFNVITG